MKQTCKTTIVAVLALSGLICSAARAADAPQGPQVSRALAKPLKAAQEALQADKLDEAMAKIKEAQSAAGERTAFDRWIIDALELQVYQKRQDAADVMPILADMAQSQYATSEQQRVWYKALAQYSFQTKDYAKAAEYAQEAIKHGATDTDTQELVAKAQYLTGRYKDAAVTMQDVVSKMDKPDEDSLKLLWQFNLKAGDEAAAGRAVEKLVTFYPRPEYWANALASLVRMDTKDGRLQLNIYRLMNEVGVLKQPSDYGEMAGLALDQGYPAETVAVLQKAFAQNVFTDRDKDRYQHLLDGAKAKAQKDQAHLADEESQAAAATGGDELVEVGAAYMTYGQFDKAVPLIQKGIAKGGLKSADDDYLLLGIAELRAHNAAEAGRAFDKVAGSANPGYARLGKLWALRAGGRGA